MRWGRRALRSGGKREGKWGSRKCWWDGGPGQARLEPSTGAEIEGAASTTNSAFWCNTVRNSCKLENTMEMKENGGLSFHFGFLDFEAGFPDLLGVKRAQE